MLFLGIVGIFDVDLTSVVTVLHWPRSVGFGSVLRKKTAVSVRWSVFRECCGQRMLSAVFKAGDFHAVLVGVC